MLFHSSRGCGRNAFWVFPRDWQGAPTMLRENLGGYNAFWQAQPKIYCSPASMRFRISRKCNTQWRLLSVQHQWPEHCPRKHPDNSSSNTKKEPICSIAAHNAGACSLNGNIQYNKYSYCKKRLWEFSRNLVDFVCEASSLLCLYSVYRVSDVSSVFSTCLKYCYYPIDYVSSVSQITLLY